MHHRPEIALHVANVFRRQFEDLLREKEEDVMPSCTARKQTVLTQDTDLVHLSRVFVDPREGNEYPTKQRARLTALTLRGDSRQ